MQTANDPLEKFSHVCDKQPFLLVWEKEKRLVHDDSVQNFV